MKKEILNIRGEKFQVVYYQGFPWTLKNIIDESYFDIYNGRKLLIFRKDEQHKSNLDNLNNKFIRVKKLTEKCINDEIRRFYKDTWPQVDGLIKVADRPYSATYLLDGKKCYIQKREKTYGVTYGGLRFTISNLTREDIIEGIQWTSLRKI